MTTGKGKGKVFKSEKRARKEAEAAAIPVTGVSFYDLRGVVKTVNKGRGFYFFTPEEGSAIEDDVFVHATATKKEDFKALDVGWQVRCQVQTAKPGEKGPRAIEVISITPPPPQKCVVKFFNRAKGYGFLTPPEGTKDVFVHMTALERSHIEPDALQSGVEVLVTKFDKSNQTKPAAFELALA